MRRTLMLMLAAALVLLLAVPVYGGQNRNFVAPLDGGQEIPGPVDTNATGVAKFQLSKDGNTLEYKLIVANIENVFGAHIHCGAVGVAGSIGVTLFSTAPPNLGSMNGILAQGSITAPDAGNGCGWANLAAVVTAIRSGDTYVNVHTLPGTPSGEIRGQIK